MKEWKRCFFGAGKGAGSGGGRNDWKEGWERWFGIFLEMKEVRLEI